MMEGMPAGIGARAEPAAKQESAGRARIEGLDGLRGLAALGVALYHFSIAYDHPGRFFPDLCIRGRYGVNLFFMISGFVMFMTLAKIERPMDFVVSRFSRLYPAYWVCVLITFLATRWPGVRVPRADGFEFAVNLTMFQTFFGVEMVDSSYWTLRVELCFYLLLLLAYASGGIGRIRPLVMGQLALAAAYWMAGNPAPPAGIPRVLFDILILPYAPYFAIGIILYRMTRMREIGDPANWLALALSCFLIKHKLPWDAFALHAVFAAALAFAGAGRGGPLAARPLAWLGLISYPFYLLHQYVGFILLDGLVPAGWPIGLAIPFVIGICLALAAGIHVWVERPMLAFIRGKYRARRARVAEGAAGAGRGFSAAARTGT